MVDLLRAQALRVGNVDLTVLAQRPLLAAVIPVMRSRLAQVLRVAETQWNVTATTTEAMGFTARGEGSAAHAVVLLIAAEE